MEPVSEVHAHCSHDLRLECLHTALHSVVATYDLEDVINVAEAYFEFVMADD